MFTFRKRLTPVTSRAISRHTASDPPASVDDPEAPLETDYVQEPAEVDAGEVVDVDRETRDREPITAVITRQIDEQRRPIIPSWLKSWAEFKRNLAWLRRHWLHMIVFHFVRLPHYSIKTLVRFPRGILRIAVTVGGWLLDGEARPLRAQAALTNKPDEWRKLAQIRDDRFRKRCYALAGAGLILAVVLAVFWVKVEDEAARAALLIILVFWIATLGSPADKPIMQNAVLTTDAPRLTSDVIKRALLALGIAGITQGEKGGSPITFVAPITRDGGMGWRADVDLPHGVTAADIQEKRRELASGLRRNMGCVWPESDPGQHPGRLVLFVGDKPLSEQKQPAWPLMKAGPISLFHPIPFGFDQRGRQVDLTLMFTNLLIGSIPRYGKTYTAREVLLACALDPTAELWLYELKGTGDLSMFEPIAHRYASGPDDETLDRVMEDLRELYRELELRAKRLSKLPRKMVPEFKVTEEIARRRALGLYPLVGAIDECQELFASKHGKEAEALCQAIIKRGPALGILLILATQRPDAKSLPTGVSANAGTRFCLRVMGHVENDMILGSGMSKNGYKAQLLGPQERGIGYLAGVFDTPVIVRTYKLDGTVPERIIERALALREAAGTLTGHAIGEQAAAGGERETPTTVLVDVLGVWPVSEPKASSAWLAEQLSERLGGRYLDWQGPDVTRALTARGVDKGQVWIDGRNLQGFLRENVEGRLQALAELPSGSQMPALEGDREAG